MMFASIVTVTKIVCMTSCIFMTVACVTIMSNNVLCIATPFSSTVVLYVCRDHGGLESLALKYHPKIFTILVRHSQAKNYLQISPTK